eukprot:gene5852-7468_t
MNNKADSSICAKGESTLEVMFRNDEGKPELTHDKAAGKIKVPGMDTDEGYSSYKYKFVVGCPMAISYEHHACYMFEVEVKGRTFGHSMYIGWTNNYSKLTVHGVWDVLDEETCKELFGYMNVPGANLFPAVSSESGIVEVVFNFGQKPFKYPVTDNMFSKGDVVPVRPVREASA